VKYSFFIGLVVNRASIKKDVSAVEEWLKRFDLILVSKQRLGLKIEGDEKNKRKALARILLFINWLVNSALSIKSEIRANAFLLYKPIYKK
jgi:activator of the mannose operon (transcriptional antiterminator)